MKQLPASGPSFYRNMIVALRRIFPPIGDKHVSGQVIIALHRSQCINQRAAR
jgi:hypothetical protein